MSELDTSQDLQEGLESAQNATKDAYNAARTAYETGKKIKDAAQRGAEAAGKGAEAAEKGIEAAGKGAEAAGKGAEAAGKGIEAAGKAAATGAEVGGETAAKGAEAVAATAGGAATGGVATAVVVGLEVLNAGRKIQKKINDYEADATSTELGQGSHWTFKAMLIAAVCWFLCCSANMEKLIPGGMEEYQEKEYETDKSFEENLDVGERTYEFSDREEFDSQYNNMLFLTNGFQAYIDGLEGFDSGGPGPMVETDEDAYQNYLDRYEHNTNDKNLDDEQLINDDTDFIGNISDVFKGALDAVIGDVMKIPGIGELVNCLEINTGLMHNVTRSSTDSYSMEFTVAKAKDYKTINNRINALESLAESSNRGADGNLYTVNKNGQSYYVGAIVDGFAKPGAAYKVTLNTGQTFNMVAVDVKSLHDAAGTGGTGQVDTSYGHGYLVNGGQSVQMNICEFLDASTSTKSCMDYSATNYANAPMSKGTYVTQVESLGAF